MFSSIILLLSLCVFLFNTPIFSAPEIKTLPFKTEPIKSMLEREVLFSKYTTCLKEEDIDEILKRIEKEKEEGRRKKKPIIINSNKTITTAERRELLAKMVYCEARGESYKCQIYVCSAIVNLIEYNNNNYGILDTTRYFDPAPWYRSVTPREEQYKVVDNVLSGKERIAHIKYFRDDHYHNFGTPIAQVDNMFFSA